MGHSTPPDFATARDHVLREVLRLTRLLRGDGVAVPANAALPAVEALIRVGLEDRRRVRAAMRATLVTDPRDCEILDEHFPEFWYRLRTGLEATATADEGEERAEDSDGESGRTDIEGATEATDLADALDGDAEESIEEAAVLSRRVSESPADSPDAGAAEERAGTYSAAGSRTEVADATGDAGRVSTAAMRRFAQTLATLSGRRWSRARAGDAVDARRALRESLETGGVTVTLPARERNRTAVRACVLVDVSQSVLDAIDREFLLSVVDELVDGERSVRAFFFDTDIREVTGVFETSEGDPATALERAEVAWGGGTRIGDSLDTLRRRWPHAVGRRTVTLVISDGLDVGEIGSLEDGMTWLARRSRAVVWLNPLAATREYEPTCRGMATALPYVDGLFAFAGPADVDEVTRQLERRGPGGSVGYEHDFRDRSGMEP
ncbi:MAG: VWA domain-containing protein [Haloarculaceae archaeon]